MKNAKKLLIILIVISMFTSMLAISASAEDTLAYGAATVDTDILNLRSGPGLTFSVISTLTEGDIIVILERTNSEWYKINSHGTVGYVNTPYLKDVLTAENFNALGRVTGDYVNIRVGPSTTSDLLGTYIEETVMIIIGINNGWYKVRHDDLTGYVRSDYMEIISGTRASSTAVNATYGGSVYTTPPANIPLGQQIAEYALQFLGVDYVYGGTSPSGFDCSGLTTYVYREYGYSLTRDANGQYRDNGVPVAKADLIPGDLVFFSSNGGSSVTHVGIYIGDNEFVHASTYTVGTIVSRLDSAYYISVWYGAKRII